MELDEEKVDVDVDTEMEEEEKCYDWVVPCTHFFILSFHHFIIRTIR
jgi:hypothetical protein